MSRFPLLTETFILREMSALQSAGTPILVFPLHRERPRVIHPEALPWLRRARWLPLTSPRLVWANVATLVAQPRAYASVWARALRENASDPAFLLRTLVVVPKAALAARRMQEAGVAHVHAHYATHPALAAWVVHRLLGIPYSVTVHAHDIFPPGPMAASTLGEARFVVAVSRYNHERLGTLYGSAVSAKTHVVHCGVEPAAYPYRPRRRTAGAPLRLLSIGSLQEYKGHRHLVACCRQLRARGVPFECLIIGSGPERAALQRAIDNAGLAAAVRLVGALPQEAVAARLQAADCYVQPSVRARSGQMEGIPVALMEAMASGVPVVATRLSGVPELVRESDTGLLVAPESPSELAEAVLAVWRDPSAAERRALAARRLIEQEFDLASSAARMAELFAAPHPSQAEAVR
jgi:glycosyltransferase involved in cell wall biosynthesis